MPQIELPVAVPEPIALVAVAVAAGLPPVGTQLGSYGELRLAWLRARSSSLDRKASAGTERKPGRGFTLGAILSNFGPKQLNGRET